MSKVYPPCEHPKPWRVYIEYYPSDKSPYLWIVARCTNCDKRLSQGPLLAYCDRNSLTMSELSKVMNVTKKTLKKWFSRSNEPKFAHRLQLSGHPLELLESGEVKFR